MTFQDLYEEVGEMYPDADIAPADAKNYVNRAYLQMASGAFRFYENDSETTFSTVAATASYAIGTIAAGMREIITLRDTTSKFILEPRTPEWYDRQDNSSSVTGQPEYYVRYGSNVLLYPNPDAVYAMSLRFRKLPDVMTTDGEEPIFPDEWHEAILWHACARAGMVLGFTNKAINLKNDALALISSLQEDFTKDSRRRIGQITIERTRRTTRKRQRIHAEFDESYR